jgi:pantoate--beta-alanine ligase
MVARLEAGEPVQQVLEDGRAALEAAGLAPDYLALRDADSLASITAPARDRVNARLLVAARLGRIRLLDNLPVDNLAVVLAPSLP